MSVSLPAFETAALSEYQSKKRLGSYGIPINREILVQNKEAAIAAARDIGFPVALKASSPELTHKSEIGCVALALDNADDVAAAFDRVAGTLSAPPEGFLVQEMIIGQRELVVGLNRDPQLGPCVMIGLGGTMTEIFKDTVFRCAPFDRIEALDMIDELRTRQMLGPFRGQPAADIDALCDLLIAVGRMALEEADIVEIDINPIIIDTSGRPVAVDALVVLESRPHD